MKLGKYGTITMSVLTLAGLVAGCGSQSSSNNNSGSNGTGASSNSSSNTSASSGNSTSASTSSGSQVDVSTLKTPAGQPLLQIGSTPTPPPRPSDPNSLPKTNILHWWDMEYAWDVNNKVNLPNSPGNGPKGKTVIMIEPGPHPYFTAYSNGAKEVAKAYGINLKIMVGDWTVNQQTQQVSQAINQHPDLIVLAPVGADVAVQEFRSINQANIPLIASNLLPTTSAMKYALTWTGPDDWAQMKTLADSFAKIANDQGGYAVVRHDPGTSPYYSRNWGVIDELLKVAPNMKVLAYQTGNLDATKSEQLVSGWLTKYGSQLKGLMLAGDGNTFVGAEKAIQNAQRTDIKIVAAGNSKIGMDAVKAGTINAETYQSAMSDGALPVYEAAQWFSGKTVPKAAFLPQKILTTSNVSQYYPPQW